MTLHAAVKLGGSLGTKSLHELRLSKLMYAAFVKP